MKKDSWNKYALYEASVQDTEHDVEIFNEIFKEIRPNKSARSLREDFAGTHMLSCEWVKDSPRKTAVALDLDPEPLAYGDKHHVSRLKPGQKKRIKVFQKDVRTVSSPKVDLVTALNFSYWIFKERKVMKRYFKSVFNSLKSDGVFIMDVMGGLETMDVAIDREKFTIGRKKFTYIWNQEYFNPINHHALFSISFALPNGKRMKRAFTYDWRHWSIPELKDILNEVGFKNVYIYWEGDGPGDGGNGHFSKVEEEENCEVWIAYLVASKI